MPDRLRAEVQVGSSRYILLDECSAKLPRPLPKWTETNDDWYLPATGITWESPSFENHELATVCQTYLAHDDVWNADFTALILIIRSSQAPCKITTDKSLSVVGCGQQIPCGPLIVEKATGRLFTVCKLVPDTHFAFVSATVPTQNSGSGFDTLDTGRKPQRDSHAYLFDNTVQPYVDVAVPSRLYFTPTNSKPLAGLRIGVKDSIALEGLRTGYGSQAWYDVCEAEHFTAPCIQLLIDAGAVIVGKLVASEFCEGVEPTEWTEGTCPFNPRGDGQQKPSSSSTGSAVAIAAYEWLDITIGTDTGGSIRHPAGVNGVFGQRPTAGSIDLDGVLGATNLFNTVGIFARSVELFTKVGSFLSNAESMHPTPTRQQKYNILYPIRELSKPDCPRTKPTRWFPHPNADPAEWTAAEKQLEIMVAQMEAELDCQRTYFNIDDFWTATAPKGQPKCLDEATGQIYGDITTSSACATGIDDFIQRYRTVHGGQEPAIGGIVKARLEYGRQIADSKIAAALQATAAFKTWIETTFFALDDQNTTTVIIFPQSHGVPDYRDDESRWGGNLFIETFSVYAFGYLCGCPDYTIPVGELPYMSRVTGQTGYLPVSLSLVGQPGADEELFTIVRRLHNAGVVSDVQAGNRTFLAPVLSD